MGRQKLLLQIGERTVIARLLDVLGHKTIVGRVVVMRRDDVSLATEVTSAGGTVVQPEINPPDMRSSVERGLEYVSRLKPANSDGWLLVPADHPMLDAAVLELLIGVWQRNPDRIVVPTYLGRRGHPTLFPWKLAAEVSRLPENEGLNLLLRRNSDLVSEVPVDTPAVVTDLDTPEDFETLVRRFEGTDETS